ncbi:XTP/dITP diphosphatase [Geopsychrobacter electrodiphilus]|uniref:XTP/dITP diphosphatase n=1 Tax=Geopsychrobacter electrodiphilus TaxID=225196 RepID=UPI00037F1899|nr:XTP/dITP diphosphatase [Geopsychrobacter electrodiphilus]
MKLLVATKNAGKLREISALFVNQGVEVLGLNSFPNAPDVVEDGDSFSANARKKALEIARFSNCLTLADDSGLVVPELGGAPGIFSARFAGEAATDEQNNLKLLNELKTIPPEKRQAYFCCVMALADPEGRCRTSEGRLLGHMISEFRGKHGFGYDPLFLVPEYGKTLAELPFEIKNRISHRGKALSQLLPLFKIADPLQDGL